MRKTNKLVILEYESPQMEMLQLAVEQGFANSTFMDDMTESKGEWAAY